MGSPRDIYIAFYEIWNTAYIKCFLKESLYIVSLRKAFMCIPSWTRITNFSTLVCGRISAVAPKVLKVIGYVLSITWKAHEPFFGDNNY